MLKQAYEMLLYLTDLFSEQVVKRWSGKNACKNRVLDHIQKKNELDSDIIETFNEWELQRITKFEITIFK